MHSETVKWLALCGIGVPIFHLIIPIILGIFDRDYNPMRQYLSELAAPKHPFAMLVNASFFVAGLLTLPFAVGMYFGLPKSAFAWIVSILLFLDGLSNIGAGIFSLRGNSFAVKAHTVISQIGAMGNVVVPFIFWLAVRRESEWHGIAVFTLVMQAIIAVTFALYAYATESRKQPWAKSVIGLFQKLYLGVHYTWFVTVAVWLVR